MRSLRLLFAILAISSITTPLAAQRHSSRSSSGSVRVHGYTRRDGSYVHPYTRPAPHAYAAPKSRSYAPKAHRSPRSQPPSGSRDSRGRIRRSRDARADFMRRTGYPRGRPGYVIDHIVPLCAGGADAPSNMQWQTVEAARVKDRQERATCSARRHD